MNLASGTKIPGRSLLQFMMGFCFQKGFSTLYLHANADLIEFYRGYGFQVVGDEFTFSDHNYVEMILAHAGSPSAALSLDDSPLIINRPEGRWHEQGPQEESLKRISRHSNKVG